MTDAKSSTKGFDPNTFSALHLNIRSMKKNFENVKEFLKNLRVNFIATFLSETWRESQEESQKSNYILSGKKHFYQYRQYGRGGGVCVFLWKNRFIAKLDKIR